MATTTNYGWTTPDDTALVKDGASAIRTLGSSVDTTTKNLNPSTTLGDIEYRSSTANTNTRLGIGSTGNVLTVAAGVPSWAAPAAGGMTLLSTSTMSGSSVTVSSINQTYNTLYVILQGWIFNTNVDPINIKVNGSTTNCQYVATGADPNAFNTNFTDERIRTANNILNTGGLNAFVLRIDNYASTSYYKAFNFYGGGAIAGAFASYSSSGLVKTTSAITELVFATQSGYTLTAGQALIYGVK